MASPLEKLYIVDSGNIVWLLTGITHFGDSRLHSLLLQKSHLIDGRHGQNPSANDAADSVNAVQRTRK